jgi:nucleotide-binding universal stress UspA family protein
MLEGPLMADISGWLGAQPFSAQLAQFRELMEQKGNSVIEAFNDLCEKHGVPAEGQVKTGLPARVILDEETRAELIVLGQKGEHAEWSGDLTGSTVERVVRHSIKPCLVTPETFRPIDKIMACYDGSGHSSRALHEAIELALALAAPLVILTVAEHQDVDHARDLAEDAMKLARAHECAAAQMVVEGLPDDTILNKASELKVSLIVVGAYGHSRMREMILGSTTTQLITRTNIPVMLVR